MAEDKDEFDLQKLAREIAIVLMFVATVYLGLGIARLGSNVFRNITSACPNCEVPPAPVPLEKDGISNDSLLALLSVLAIFGGAMGYVFQHIVKKEIEQDALRREASLRIASTIQANDAMGQSLWHQHFSLKGLERAGVIQKDDHSDLLLKEAIDTIEQAIEDAKLVSIDEIRKDIESTLKNNWVYYLACRGEDLKDEEREPFVEWIESSVSDDSYNILTTVVLALYRLFLKKSASSDSKKWAEGKMREAVQRLNRPIGTAFEKKSNEATWSVYEDKKTYIDLLEKYGKEESAQTKTS